MKALVRSFSWWPGTNQQTEHLVKECRECQQVQMMSKQAITPIRVAVDSQQWFHIDFSGPFLGRLYLVVVDAHTKLLGVFCMKTITAEQVAEKAAKSLCKDRIARTACN